MEEPKRFSDILRDAMDARDFNSEKLAAATGVSEQFIRALIENTPHNVPPSTYARGYVNKIAKTLDAKPEELWGAYAREYNPKSSGALDLLPQNRFALTAIDKRWLVGGVVGIIVVVYIATNLNRLQGVPRLTITNPIEPSATSQAPSIVIKGMVENSADTLTINDVGVVIPNDGFFEHEFILDPGVNMFVVTAKRFLGKSISETLQVNYEPPEPSASPPPRKTATSTLRSL